MILLPVAPSTNNLFFNVPGRGRIKSTEYNRWLCDAGVLLKQQSPAAMMGAVEVTIRIPEKTRGDLDNRIKAPLDLLVKHGVIEDDRFVRGIYVSRHNCEQMEIEVIQA
jgi:Holliday junction resolvase RusA-like endonuclease